MRSPDRRRPLALAAATLAGAALTALALAGAGSGAAAAGSPPAVVSVPAVSGAAEVGGVLTVSTGSWSGDTPIAFAFQWRRCDASGGSCAALGGATGQTYTATSADVGHRLRATVTATNAAGSASALSAATAAVVDPRTSGPPRNVSAPSVTGRLAVGSLLSVQRGTWTGALPIAFSYVWYRCDARGGDCGPIRGATGTSYRIASADAGHRLVVAVTARNSAGSARAVVTAGNVPAAPAPANVAPPKVSGKLAVGSVVSVSSGTWSGATPIRISYQWQRCNPDGGDCAQIRGATGNRYRVTTSDVGHRLIVVVTATNSAGTARQVATAGNVGGSAPALVRAPTVAGSAVVGATLTVSAGTWTGTAPIGLAYEWFRCDRNGGNCRPIAGATQAAYRVAAADAGHRLVVVVTARNSLGTKQATVTAGTVGGVAPSAGAVRAAAVELPNRLVVDGVKFAPNPVRSRRAFVTARFHVSDTAGRSVSGALVYMIGIPYNRIPGVPEQATDSRGWATFRFRPTSRLPLVRGGALVVFVRARTPQGPLLAGVSTRRLVQLGVGAPR